MSITFPAALDYLCWSLVAESMNAITQTADYQAFQPGVRKIFLAVAGKCGI